MVHCVWNDYRWFFWCVFIDRRRAMTILFIIVGMSLVTMIPRLLPAFLIGKLEFKSWINRWLNAIPYAALGALIFPGIMSVKPDEPHIGIIGGVVAIVL